MDQRIARTLRISLYALGTIVVCYCVGFYAIMFGVRSEDDDVRKTALRVETVLYYPWLRATKNESSSLIRRIYLQRVAVMCRGHEHRCHVAGEPAS